MIFNKKELDLIKEALNSGIGRAALALSEIFNDSVEINLIEITLKKLSEAEKWLKDKYSKTTVVYQDFFGRVEGKTYIIFSHNSVKLLLNYLSKKDDIERDFTNDVLLEISNIITNNLMGAIGNFLSERIEYSLPEISVNKFSELNKKDDYYVLIVNSELTLKTKDMKMDFLIIFSIKSFDVFKDLFLKVVEKNENR